MKKQNETIEAENVEINDEVETDIEEKDDRSRFEKLVDEHPKGFVTFCTITGAAIGASAVAVLTAIFGGDSTETADPDSYHDYDSNDGANDVMA